MNKRLFNQATAIFDLEKLCCFPRYLSTCISIAALGIGLSTQAAGGQVEKPTLAVANAESLRQTLPEGIKAQGVKPIISLEGISEYQLTNGLRILLAPDQSKPTTTVNMTYLVGSRHENYGETGMAHLLEHMLFKGTPTTPNALAEFSKRGFRPNGSTSFDRTNYFASFASNPENLSWYIQWQADAMVNSLIAKTDLDSEMTVVRNEFESGENNPGRVLMQQMLATAYQWHNYGHTAIGARSDIENVDIDQLRRFYQLYYQPDNAVLIISGKFDSEHALEVIANAFNKIPRPNRTLPRLYTLDPVQDGERQVTVRRVGGIQLVGTMYHIPSALHPDFAALELVTSILGDSPSGRLYKALVEKRIAASVYGYTLDTKDPGTVMFGAQLPMDIANDSARDILIKTLESVKLEPITKEELERAKTRWLKEWELAYSDPEQVGLALSESIALGDWRMFFVQRDRIQQVNLEDVQRTAQSYLLASNRTLGQFIPISKPERAPAMERVDPALAVMAYKGNPNFTAGEQFEYSLSNIEKRTQREQLSPAIKVALLPKSTRGKLVNANLVLHFGSEQSLKNQRETGIAVAKLLSYGTNRLSREQIQDYFDQARAQVSISGSASKLSIQVATVQEQLIPVLTLLSEILKQPSFPENALDEYKRQALTSLQNAEQDPTQKAINTISRHGNPYPKDDIRYIPRFDESVASIQSLSRDDLIKFHKEFYGAQALEFSAVGDFDAPKTKETIYKLFNDWAAPQPYVRIANPFTKTPPENFVIDTPDKANAFIIYRTSLALQDIDNDYPALFMANWILGQSSNSRLWDQIREQQGLSYDVRSNLSVSSLEPHASWTVYAIFAPQNRNRIVASLQQEMDRAYKQGFYEEEIKQALPGILATLQLNRSQDDVLAATLSTQLDLGRTMGFSEQFETALSQLTIEQVNKAFKKYWQSTLSSAIAGDFKAEHAPMNKALK